ncbi:MAG: hypothetical protein WD066_06780 [Planctomycetaceae bacterium]
MPRIILLGASNVSLSLSVILDMLAAAHDEPFEVLTAIGHGRSYGMRSQVLFRTLPGIVDCGLWDELRSLPPATGPTLALVTDVGNDLVYGAPPPRILEWVDACLARLAGPRAELTMSLLPMASVARLTALRYHAFRTILFTGKGPTWPRMRECAAELDAGLLELGKRYGAAVIEPVGDWYGIDPIHVTRANRPRAWRAVFDCWPSLAGRIPTHPRASWGGERVVQASIAGRMRLWRLRPEREWWFGRLRRTRQPVIDTERLTVRMF